VNDETTIIQERKPETAAGQPHGAPPPHGHAAPPRPARKQRGPLGLPEIIALAASALLLVAAVASYFLLLRPQSVRAADLKNERAQLEKLLEASRGSVTQGKDTQTSVRDILGSLQRFEIEHLGQGAGGSTNTIKELHRLMLKNRLRISGGMTYTQLEETLPGAEKKPQREGSAQRTVQSIFPGVGITMTVEGSYANLRRFIREVEASPQFVVINAVELEGVTDTVAAASAASDGATATMPNASGARGTLVSLRLDMATYFRRTSAAGDLTPTVGGPDGTAR
jgi:hypothetical protein